MKNEKWIHGYTSVVILWERDTEMIQQSDKIPYKIHEAIVLFLDSNSYVLKRYVSQSGYNRRKMNDFRNIQCAKEGCQFRKPMHNFNVLWGIVLQVFHH